MEWKQESDRTKEDHLLFAHWRATGGVVITEVPVGSPKKPFWPEGSIVRRIDGVRILHPPGAVEGIKAFQTVGEERLQEWVKGRRVEVIEVKARLNRLAIGQAIVGVDMFLMEYPAAVAHAVVVAEIGDPALELICRNRGIEVRVQES